MANLQGIRTRQGEVSFTRRNMEMNSTKEAVIRLRNKFDVMGVGQRSHPQLLETFNQAGEQAAIDQAKRLVDEREAKLQEARRLAKLILEQRH